VARRAEATHAALAVRQLVDLDELEVRDGKDDELRDAHARLDDKSLAGIGVDQVDEQLAAVAGIDEARAVDDRDAMLRREAGPRLYEACVAVGDRNGQSGRNEGTLPRGELDPLAGRQIEPRIAAVRAPRDDGVRP
jgi:hypothetical protein